jgi:spore coat polysaccharide biosynthesis predicted glycosyltransferase SpsG
MATSPIAFIVRASVRDGLGHLVRSLCVLRELAQRSEVKLFLLGDASGCHLIEEAKIPWVSCGSDEAAADEVALFLSQLVVFDTLNFEAAAFDRIAARAVTVSLSPVFSQMSKVDHLFHRTVNEDPAWALISPFPKVHKGLKYAVLPSWLKRLSTRHYREQAEEERLAVAISMGGADAPNRTLSLLKLLGHCPERLVLFVALGDAYTHSYEELLECAAQNRQEIILLKSNESMWRVVKNAALLLCAGGLTTYEAAFVGLPTINILQRPEWTYLFSELVEKGGCLTLEPTPESLGRASDLVTALAQDRARLMQMHLATKRLIPDGASRRVASMLVTLNR